LDIIVFLPSPFIIDTKAFSAWIENTIIGIELFLAKEIAEASMMPRLSDNT
jgi:hypothetical protein